MVTVEIVINLLNGQKSAFFTLAEKLRTGSKNGGHLLGWARLALPHAKSGGYRATL